MEGFERMSTEVNANVIKRNGVEVIFDKAKIINAVEKANEEVPKLHRLSHYQITALADMIATRALESSHAVNVEDIQDTVIESLNEIFNEFHITISRTKVGEKRSSKTCRTRKTIQTGNEALHGTVAKSYNPSFVRENRVLKYEKIDTYMFDPALKEKGMQEEQIQDSSTIEEQVEALKNNEQQQDNN